MYESKVTNQCLLQVEGNKDFANEIMQKPYFKNYFLGECQWNTKVENIDAPIYYPDIDEVMDISNWRSTEEATETAADSKPYENMTAKLREKELNEKLNKIS